MGIFLKAVFMLLLTGPKAVSKRLNKGESLSEASTLEDSQPTPVGGQTNDDYEFHPAGRNRLAAKMAFRDAGRFFDKAFKGADKWLKNEKQKFQNHQNNKNKMRQMTASDQAGGRATEVTPFDEADRFTSHMAHLHDEAEYIDHKDLAKVRRDAYKKQLEEEEEAKSWEENKVRLSTVRHTDQYDSNDEETEPEEEESSPAMEKESLPAALPEEIDVASAALTPAEVAEAKWAEAPPASETVAETEESEASPAREAVKESFAHLSTAPVFSVYAVALAVSAAALELA